MVMKLIGKAYSFNLIIICESDCVYFPLFSKHKMIFKDPDDSHTCGEIIATSAEVTPNDVVSKFPQQTLISPMVAHILSFLTMATPEKEVKVMAVLFGGPILVANLYKLCMFLLPLPDIELFVVFVGLPCAYPRMMIQLPLA